MIVSEAPMLRSLSLALLLAAPCVAQELHLPLSSDGAERLRRAERLRDMGELGEALDLYRGLLDAERQEVIASVETSTRFDGLTERTLASLRAMPAEGVELFRVRYDAEALKTIEAAGDAFVALARAYERFPLSTHAAPLLERLAKLAGPGTTRARWALSRLVAHHAGEAKDLDGARRALEPSPVITTESAAPRILGPRFATRTFELDRSSTNPLPARHVPLVHGGRVFVATADQLLAYDVLTGEEAPRIPRLGPPYPDPNAKALFSLARAGDALVTSFVERIQRDVQYRGIPIKVKVAIRKLAMFDTMAWRWTWNHARLLEGGPLERWSFPCAPAVDDGLLFAPATSVEGLVSSHLAAFDARSGDVLWSQWLVSGQIEQTMYGEQAVEPLCVPAVARDGIVYHSTSLGCVAALDAVTGRPLWVTAYETMEVRAPRGYYADPRPIEWENNAPLLVGDVLVVAPMDSPRYYGLDARTGAVLWSALRRSNAVDGAPTYLLGATHDAVLLGGAGDVRCVETLTGALRWRTSLRGPQVAGRGVVVGDVLHVPIEGGLLTLEVDTGKRLGQLATAVTGNLVLAGEHAIIAGPGTLVVHRAE
jgi:outer membrane protein assembly factor BamB